GLVTALPEARDRARPGPLRQALAPRRGQEIVVAEARWLRPERLEEHDLDRRVGDVILTADNVGDRLVDVVDHGGQRVEEQPVLANQHWIGQRAEVDRLRAAEEVVPFYGRRLLSGLAQAEAP